MHRTIPAVAAVLLTAACASTTPAAAPASSAVPTLTPQPSPTSASPTPSPSASAGHGTTISLSTQAKNLPPGPFRITPVSCGPYTAAQRAKFATTAKGGLVYRYTNVSNSLTGMAKLEVDFVNGTEVLGDNVTGSAPEIGPGQSAEGYVDALNSGGQDVAFTGCELMQYTLPGTTGTGFAP